MDEVATRILLPRLDWLCSGVVPELEDLVSDLEEASATDFVVEPCSVVADLGTAVAEFQGSGTENWVELA